MRTSLLAASGFFAIAIGACAGDDADSEPMVIADTTVPAGDAAGGAALATARTGQYGPFIADASGRALYLLEADSARESTCYDACALAWPPYLAPQGTPTAADQAVQAGLIGTRQRRDGSTQVTYGGHPLYYYSRDGGTGQATGQDVHDQWGEWYLVTPQGEPLESHEGSGS